MKSTHGPLSFFLFWLVEKGSGRIHCATDMYIDPALPMMADIFDPMGRQDEVGLFLVDEDLEQSGYLIFRNVFQVSQAMATFRGILRENPCTSFMAAKQECEARYSVADLLRMS